MRIAAVVAVFALSTAQAGEPTRAKRSGECLIRIGPNDRVVRDASLTVKDGETLDAAVSIHGDVVVQRGGKVSKVVALGGSVSVEGGGVVLEQAIAIGGDVKLAKGARVEKDALALGGQVRVAQGASVGGGVVGLSLQLGQELQSRILSELRAEGSSCRIEREAD